MTSYLKPSRILYSAPPSGAEWVVTGLVCAGVLAWLVAAGSAPWWVSVVEAVVAGLLAAGSSWVGRAGLRVLSWIGVVVACSLGFALLSRVQSVSAEALLPVVAGATLGSALGALVHTRIFGVLKPAAPRLIRADEPASAAVEAAFLSARPSGVMVLESERQHLIVAPADAGRVEVVWLPGSGVIAQARLGITSPADAEGSVRVLRGGGDAPTVSAQRTLARKRAVDVARGFRSSGGQLPAFAGIEWVDDRRAAEAARRSVRLADGACIAAAPAVSSRAHDGERAAMRRHGAATVLVLAALACVLGGVVAAPWIDRQDVKLRECAVTSASAGSPSGAGKGGIESAVTTIKTSDCGEVVLSNGVTRDNRDELAAELNAGGRFEFGLGPISRWLKEAGSPFGRHTEVQSVTKVR